jgi:hypothetical protein
MTIYVGPTYNTWTGSRCCNLSADTAAELFELGNHLRLPRPDFTTHFGHPHYVIPELERSKVIALGAVSLTEYKYGV